MPNNLLSQSQASRNECEEKENVPEQSKTEEEEEIRNEESKSESRMEVYILYICLVTFVHMFYFALLFSLAVYQNCDELVCDIEFWRFVEFPGISEIVR